MHFGKWAFGNCKIELSSNYRIEKIFGSLGRVTYTYDVLACLWSWWRCFKHISGSYPMTAHWAYNAIIPFNTIYSTHITNLHKESKTKQQLQQNKKKTHSQYTTIIFPPISSLMHCAIFRIPSALLCVAIVFVTHRFGHFGAGSIGKQKHSVSPHVFPCGKIKSIFGLVCMCMNERSSTMAESGIQKKMKMNFSMWPMKGNRMVRWCFCIECHTISITRG